MGGAGVTSVCPSMMWRDPRVAAGLFTASSSSGSGAELRWHLEFATTDQTTKKELRASATVAGNGTILRLTNGTAELSPLRQFRTDGVGEAAGAPSDPWRVDGGRCLAMALERWAVVPASPVTSLP